MLRTPAWWLVLLMSVVMGCGGDDPVPEESSADASADGSEDDVVEDAGDAEAGVDQGGGDAGADSDVSGDTDLEAGADVATDLFTGDLAGAQTELPERGGLEGVYVLESLEIGADDSWELDGDTVIVVTGTEPVEVAGDITCATAHYRSGSGLEVRTQADLTVSGSISVCAGTNGDPDAINDPGQSGGRLVLASRADLDLTGVAELASGDGGEGSPGGAGGAGGALDLQGARVILPDREGILVVGSGGRGGSRTFVASDFDGVETSEAEPFQLGAHGGDAGHLVIAGELVGSGGDPLVPTVALSAGQAGGDAGSLVVEAPETPDESASSGPVYLRGANGGDGGPVGGEGGRVTIHDTAGPDRDLTCVGGLGGDAQLGNNLAFVIDPGDGGNVLCTAGNGPDGHMATGIGGAAGRLVVRFQAGTVSDTPPAWRPPVEVRFGNGGDAVARGGHATAPGGDGGDALATGGEVEGCPEGDCHGTAYRDQHPGTRLLFGAGGFANADGGDGFEGEAGCPDPGGAGGSGGDATAVSGDDGEGGAQRHATAVGGNGAEGGQGLGEGGADGQTSATGVPARERSGTPGREGRTCPVACDPAAAPPDEPEGLATIAIDGSACTCAVITGTGAGLGLFPGQPDEGQVDVVAPETAAINEPGGSVPNFTVPVDTEAEVELFDLNTRKSMFVMFNATAESVSGATIACQAQLDVGPCYPSQAAETEAGDTGVRIDPESLGCAAVSANDVNAIQISTASDDHAVISQNDHSVLRISGVSAPAAAEDDGSWTVAYGEQVEITLTDDDTLEFGVILTVTAAGIDGVAVTLDE